MSAKMSVVLSQATFIGKRMLPATGSVATIHLQW